MGKYTEIIFGASLKDTTPDKVIDNIHYLIGTKEMDNPEYDEMVLMNNASYYFGVSNALRKFWYDDNKNSWTLSFRSNFKNYNKEIERFIEWIDPYIESGSGNRNMYAIVMVEDEDDPTIYFKGE